MDSADLVRLDAQVDPVHRPRPLLELADQPFDLDAVVAPGHDPKPSHDADRHSEPMPRVVAPALCAVVLGGCGGHTVSPGVSGPSNRLLLSRERQEARLFRDVALIRAETRRTKVSSLKGTPALRRLTARFIVDYDRSSAIPRLRKNRMIDHAVGALAGTCDQCFQQLEAIRPIITR